MANGEMVTPSPLPNVFMSVLVLAILNVATVIIIEASLELAK